jgi:hypothetical protein
MSLLSVINVLEVIGDGQRKRKIFLGTYTRAEIDLSEYCSKVTVIHEKNFFKNLLASIWNSWPNEIVSLCRRWLVLRII